MKKFISILFISLLFYSCNSIDPVELNEFQMNFNKWKSHDITSYSITLKMSCFCIPTDPIDIKIENNKINEQVLEFNETHGFPEYIYFNREEMLVDEEIGYTISSFNID